MEAHNPHTHVNTQYIYIHKHRKKKRKKERNKEEKKEEKRNNIELKIFTLRVHVIYNS